LARTGGFWSCSRHCYSSAWRCGWARSPSGSAGAHAADVFHDNPLTGKSYIILTDIVYYLIFTAYILFTVRFERANGWPIEAGTAQLQYEAARVGGILLIIGV